MLSEFQDLSRSFHDLDLFKTFQIWKFHTEFHDFSRTLQICMNYEKRQTRGIFKIHSQQWYTNSHLAVALLSIIKHIVCNLSYNPVWPKHEHGCVWDPTVLSLCCLRRQFLLALAHIPTKCQVFSYSWIILFFETWISSKIYRVTLHKFERLHFNSWELVPMYTFHGIPAANLKALSWCPCRAFDKK